MKHRGKMKQPTKQELRDRIANADACNVRLLAELKRLDRLTESKAQEAKRATIAAYALLVTLFVIVLFEVIL